MPHFEERRQKQQSRDEEGDLLDLSSLFVPLDSRAASQRPTVVADDSDDDPASVPQITKLPEGITVTEQRMGTAIGQWVFVMLCKCGRRWFALHAMDKAKCPRCERWVHVEADPRIPG